MEKLDVDRSNLTLGREAWRSMQGYGFCLDDCNVFVKYLPPELSDRDFYKMFKCFGTIISSKIMVDQATGKSLGYGFVRYVSSADSQRAIAAMNGHRVANKRLLCKLANQSPSSSSSFNPEFVKNPLLVRQTPSDNVYIKPLLSDTSEDDLRALFGEFGVIVDCKVMIDRHTGVSRQIGFVRFETVDQATLAIDKMNNYKLDPAAPPLIVKYADTKEQKIARKTLRQQQQQQYHTYPGTNQPLDAHMDYINANMSNLGLGKSSGDSSVDDLRSSGDHGMDDSSYALVDNLTGEPSGPGSRSSPVMKEHVLSSSSSSVGNPNSMNSVNLELSNIMKQGKMMYEESHQQQHYQQQQQQQHQQQQQQQLHQQHQQHHSHHHQQHPLNAFSPVNSPPLSPRMRRAATPGAAASSSIASPSPISVPISPITSPQPPFLSNSMSSLGASNPHSPHMPLRSATPPLRAVSPIISGPGASSVFSDNYMYNDHTDKIDLKSSKNNIINDNLNRPTSPSYHYYTASAANFNNNYTKSTTPPPATNQNYGGNPNRIGAPTSGGNSSFNFSSSLYGNPTGGISESGSSTAAPSPIAIAAAQSTVLTPTGSPVTGFFVPNTQNPAPNQNSNYYGGGNNNYENSWNNYENPSSLHAPFYPSFHEPGLRESGGRPRGSGGFGASRGIDSPLNASGGVVGGSSGIVSGLGLSSSGIGLGLGLGLGGIYGGEANTGSPVAGGSLSSSNATNEFCDFGVGFENFAEFDGSSVYKEDSNNYVSYGDSELGLGIGIGGGIGMGLGFRRRAGQGLGFAQQQQQHQGQSGSQNGSRGGLGDEANAHAHVIPTTTPINISQ